MSTTCVLSWLGLDRHAATKSIATQAYPTFGAATINPEVGT